MRAILVTVFAATLTLGQPVRALFSILFAFCGAMAVASPAQTLTTLVNFNGPNGSEPRYGSLVQGTDGNFYGTTRGGGANSRGMVFKMTPSGTLTTLYSFCSQSNCSDGSDPDAGLVLGSNGNFYGVTTAGGISASGTVFKITPGGTLTVLHSFMGTDGYGPAGTLLQASDGAFYGTTPSEGAHGFGTVFKITSNGTLTTLYNFCLLSGCADGGNPFAGLMQGSDGNFYGTTSGGGASLFGTVFKITSNGTLTTLYSFAGSDGAAPYGKLVQASDGNLYGTTSMGGNKQICAFGCGTIFKITRSGTFTSLHSFNLTDGGYVIAGLIQASDGNFYGAAGTGGNSHNCGNGCGTIFKMTPSGTLTTLHSFAGYATDGSLPVGGLLQASNGTFYGTTEAGGATGDGTLLSLTVGLSPTPWQFVPVTPCRVVDTRNPSGEFGGPPMEGGTFRSFPLPQGGCNIPANAAAYSLNVTLVPIQNGPVGYLTIWPTGEDQPLVSTMNSLDGRIKANAVIVTAGVSGGVSVYVTNTTNVVLDIDGYFVPTSGSTLAYYPLTPCRVLDTRKANGNLGGPFLTGGQERDFPVLASGCIQQDVTPQAYSMNFTVVPVQGQALGYLTVWAQGQSKPLVSTLNNLTATIVANAAIVPAGTGGGIATYPDQNTQLVADINGYFAPAGQNGLSLYPAVPCRVIDTRKGSGAFSGELTVDVVDSVCAPPATAQAYVFNATVVPVGVLGYLTLWPDGENQPVVSTLNAIDGAITSNMAIVPNQDGKTDAYASGITQLILDISSYFAP